MSKDDVIGVVGTVLSGVFATLGFLWSIGVLQLVFSFMAGAFTTYVVQHRLQIESEKRKMRRENAIVMRDRIYGPIFKEASKTLESVTSTQHSDYSVLGNLKAVMNHYLFLNLRQDLKNKLNELLNRIEKYGKIRYATEKMVSGIIRNLVVKTYRFEPDGEVTIRLLIEGIMVDAIELKQALFLGITPRDFVGEGTQKWGKAISIEVTFGRASMNLSDFELLYKAVLHEVEKESLYREEKEQRTRLIDELEDFLEQIKSFVNLE